MAPASSSQTPASTASTAASTSSTKEIKEIKSETTEKLEPLVHACFICMVEEDLTLCPHCQIIYYCGSVHAEIHRQENTCFPIIVRSKPEVGR